VTALPLLVLHAFGDEEGGAKWRAALDGGAWAGEWRCPDLRGHGRAPAPMGGFYEPTDPAMTGLREILDTAWELRPVVVGVGESSFGAEVLALGGRAGALAVVDGLGAAWPESADAAMRAEYTWLRAIASDPKACAPAPSGVSDPRIRHGYTPRNDEAYMARHRGAIRCPVLVIESPASPTPPLVVAERVETYGSGAALVQVDDATPMVVLEALRRWSAAA
jgi:pimeloyl-ACP methyl ester carboxylesterase